MAVKAGSTQLNCTSTTQSCTTSEWRRSLHVLQQVCQLPGLLCAVASQSRNDRTLLVFQLSHALPYRLHFRILLLRRLCGLLYRLPLSLCATDVMSCCVADAVTLSSFDCQIIKCAALRD